MKVGENLMPPSSELLFAGYKDDRILFLAKPYNSTRPKNHSSDKNGTNHKIAHL